LIDRMDTSAVAEMLPIQLSSGGGLSGCRIDAFQVDKEGSTGVAASILAVIALEIGSATFIRRGGMAELWH